MKKINKFDKKVSCISGGIRSVPANCNVCDEEKISSHPCYSEQAAHRHARMHLPVAPECNIQCNYCSRKYDCVNESRPGVTSELLSPQGAVLKAVMIKDKLPRLSVIGIAGPGDPLANADKTFRTFELIKNKMQDVHLCLSTNGLTLPSYIEDIKYAGVTHATVTINAVDPVVGKKIYSFIRLDGKKYTGTEAASILIERQLEGVSLLKEAGVLCKVNSVMIPGINDKHLADVSRRAKELGAFVHNIMPYIPCEGSFFNKAGQRRPSAQEMKELRENCGIEMKMMRHCKQCRADAVGFVAKEAKGGECAESLADSVRRQSCA